jgi:hypothetical protein
MGDKSPKSRQREMKQKSAANQKHKDEKDKRQQAQSWMPTKSK